jgi:hypothetical protein
VCLNDIKRELLIEGAADGKDKPAFRFGSWLTGGKNFGVLNE